MISRRDLVVVLTKPFIRSWFLRFYLCCFSNVYLVPPVTIMLRSLQSGECRIYGIVKRFPFILF